jgi:hypothetical protein
MANNLIQSHTGAGGSQPQDRMTAAGYADITSSAENAYAYASSAQNAMEAFLIDWGVPSDGHRINIQQPGVAPQNAFTDAGIGIVSTDPTNPNFGPLVITQDFARSANSQPQLVGVAYYDNSGTQFYQPGEGQGGLQIDAVNLQTGQVLSTQTWSSGGYELTLPAGQYRVIASLNDKVFQTSNVTVGNVNIEQDFVLSNSWQGGTREGAIAAAQPAPIVVTSTPVATPAPAAVSSPTALAVSTPTLAPVATSTPIPMPTPVVVSTPTPPATPTPVTVSTPTPVTVSTPTPVPVPTPPVVSQPTPEVWVVPLPNYQPTNAQRTVLSLLASSWSAWNAQ